MSETGKQPEAVSPEAQEVMRNLVTAIRAVKLYPPNNPVYSQSVRKAQDSLARFLQRQPLYSVGIQKTFFTFQQVPVAKETQMNKPIAQDLFAKGIREIHFFQGIAEHELLELFKAVALSSEEIALRSGIVAILWEKGASHIKVAEANLDEVIVAKVDDDMAPRAVTEAPAVTLDPKVAEREIVVSGRTLVLGDIMSDPRSFAAAMVEIAKNTCREGETVEDRLHDLYREAGRKVMDKTPEQSDTLFDGLARSVLEMEPKYRDKLVNGKLYGDLDAESAKEFYEQLDAEVPHDLHEIMAGRFSKAWTVQQVAVLLKKTSLKKSDRPAAPPDPFTVEAEHVPPDLADIAKEISEYTPAELEELRAISESGMESDISDASVRTLLLLLPLIQSPHHDASSEKEVSLFSSLIHQLEEALSYLLKKNDFGFAMIIIRAFRSLSVPPAFAPRLQQAIRKASSRDIIVAMVSLMRTHPKTSPKYQEAYTYLKQLAQEATPVLLEFLAEEQDRAKRLFYLDLLKELGKDQIHVIAQGLSDDRWYVVRNVVSILAESRSDQALVFLEKVVNHRNPQIRQEVIKGLITIGGRRAAAALARMLKDRDKDIQFTVLRALGMVQNAGPDESKAVMEFLEQRGITKKQQDNEVTHEAVRTLGKIGDQGSIAFLRRYERIRWWRSRKPQVALRSVARVAIEEIEKRMTDARRTK
jgi:hypothetical protein